MTAALTPLRGKRVRWSTILGLLLVPLTIAGVFLWGLWNPTERLENVTAAVVNLDEPVEVEGQLVPLGRVLAAELIAGGEDGNERQNFTWVLTDEADAAAGLDEGRFAASITIPEDFSAAATSLSDGPSEARQATIAITESDRGRLLDTALSSIVTQTAKNVVNQQLGEQFVGNIFVGMSTMQDGVATAADGATALADGGSQLAEGTRSLADGASQLAAGTGQLAAGTAELSVGAQQLAAGASGLAAGAQEAADGGAALSSGVTDYVNGVNAAITGVQGGIAQAIAPVQQLRDLIDGGVITPPQGTPEEVVAGLDQLIAQLQMLATDSPDSQLTQMKNGGTQLASGVAQSAAGQQQLATGLQEYAGGVAEFSGGVSELSSGVSALAAQTPELASGASELADGAKAAAEGTASLAEGLGEAAAGIPNYTEDEQQTMASTAVEAVTSEGGSDELFNSSGVPLFVGIALWAGALALYLVVAPLWSRTREAARGVFSLTMRSGLPAVLLGAAQGALAGIVLPIALGYTFGEGLAFFGLALLAGVAFGLLLQGLSARLGGFGRFVAFAVLVIAFVVGIVSTVPGPLQAIGDASPIGAAFTGFQAIASGSTGAGVAAFVLALWGAAGLALTAWAVARERRRAV
ncbi:YhgE/Pip domain-containing protein [Leucobacter denitrificans]|uniref:YhgE/Pip domain-containing protein n=1 Tax=Leucobacter denitrificans TaxID=683042 RepID=A0A7G9S359_9MICO|nr:YhgE/Pip family protein [Leucobacter denitrificans]QNN62284.1 YhgE/Pip domain-containing protein [Leucobacter denitrificans]